MPEKHITPVPDQGTVGRKDDPKYPARLRVRRIRDSIVSLHETLGLIREAYEQRDWQTLGYGSWQDYLAAEFGESAFPRLTREQREELAGRLADTMSGRAIAAVLGVGKSTVQRDLAVAQVSQMGHLTLVARPA